MMDATQMGALTYFRTALAQNNPNNTIGVAEHAIAGLGAGLAVSFVASPIELIKAKLQVQYAGKALYKGPIDCIRQQTRGNVLGIYQGLSACLLFRSFFWCLWGSYEFYSRKLDGYVDPKLLPFFAGGLAGIFC